MTDLPLARDFPAATEADWLKLVSETLKGAPFGKLRSKTRDGVVIEPLYRGPAASVAMARALAPEGSLPWQVTQRIDDPDARRANAQALDDLNNGASALALVLEGSPTAAGYGADGAALRALLDGVELDLIHLRLDAGGDMAAAARLLDLYGDKGFDLSQRLLTPGLDPVAALALSGGWAGRAAAAKAMAAVQARAGDLGFAGSLWLADGRVWHGAGASEAQELGLALASAAEMLRLIEQGNGDPFAAAGSMGLMLAVDQDQFLSIAKLRAARQAHASFLRALNIAPRPLDLHAETAWRMMSRRDPHVNMLRATAAVFAAGAGGADHVTVLPFTLAIGLPDRFARRMARNVQTVLARESRIGAVSDPAAGSGYVETLTREIAEKAWGVFQSIERAGGLVAGLEAGTVKAMLAETAAARANDVARRKEAITGVSEFPNLAEVPAAVLDAPRRAPSGHGLIQHRVAEPFEALRDRADAAPRRPAVFMAAMGRMADFTARAGFMQNLFAAGGIAAPVGEGFATTAEAAQAFAASGATAACLASSDAVYETLAVETVTALKAAGARTIVFAGRPGALEAALTGAGVTQFAFAGMDAVAFLDAILDAIPTEDRV